MNPEMYNTYTNKEFCRLFLHEATTPLEKILQHRLEKATTNSDTEDELEEECGKLLEPLEDRLKLVDEILTNLVDKYDDAEGKGIINDLYDLLDKVQESI